jgi:hypothetical protein
MIYLHIVVPIYLPTYQPTLHIRTTYLLWLTVDGGARHIDTFDHSISLLLYCYHILISGPHMDNGNINKLNTMTLL